MPHLHQEMGAPMPSLPHLHRDRAHPSHICTGTGLRYNCSGVDRLLCCDQKLFTGLAAQSCGSGFVNELLVVHNNDKYGGAGGKGMGTTSVNEFSPQVRSCRTVQRCTACCNMLQHGATCGEPVGRNRAGVTRGQ